MAISKAPSCEIRALVMHVYPDGIKAFGHERLDVPLGLDHRDGGISPALQLAG